MTDYKITPPPELILEWCRGWNCTAELTALKQVATQAARWGYDQGKIRSAPESPLVERVADAIAAQATSAGIVNDRPARAAILQVAVWLREQDTPASDWALRLEQEATPSPRRPKPPSLAEQALKALTRFSDEVWCEEVHADFDLIQRALEQLDD